MMKTNIFIQWSGQSGDIVFIMSGLLSFGIICHISKQFTCPHKEQQLAISLDGPHSFMLLTICAQSENLAMAITEKDQ